MKLAVDCCWQNWIFEMLFFIFEAIKPQLHRLYCLYFISNHFKSCIIVFYTRKRNVLVLKLVNEHRNESIGT